MSHCTKNKCWHKWSGGLAGLIGMYRGKTLGAIVECSGACAVTIRVHSICRIATILASVSVVVPVSVAVGEANQPSQL